MLKTEIAEFLSQTVAGTGSESYEYKRYMKMSKVVLEAMLDEATAPTREARAAASVRVRAALASSSRVGRTAKNGGRR